MKTVLLNKSGSLGQEIHLFQAPRKHLGLIKRESQRKYQCVGRAPSLRHREPSQDGPTSRYSYTNSAGGYPQTLHHLGDLIRQQKRRKVLQEQNGQEGKEGVQHIQHSHKQTCHHSASKRDCSSQSSSTRSEGTRSRFISLRNTRNDTRRNLQIQPQLALSSKGNK